MYPNASQMIAVAFSYGLCLSQAQAYELDVGATTVPPLALPISAANDAAACEAATQAWPRIVQQSEVAMREPNEACHIAHVAQLQAQLATLIADKCAAFNDRLHMQQALLREARAMYGISHAADGDGRPNANINSKTHEQIATEFIAIHDAAVAAGVNLMAAGWAAYQSDPQGCDLKARRQRYVLNFGTDAALVGRDGEQVHAGDVRDYVPLVHTQIDADLTSDFAVLQGQGPRNAGAVDDYLQAAFNFAQRTHAAQLLFVNMAGGQISSFAPQVAAMGQTRATDARYIEFTDWPDGKLVAPTELATFVTELTRQATSGPGKTLLVVNCNAGLDRSGTVNALMQLSIHARRDAAEGARAPAILARGYGRIPDVVGRIKLARPHAISSAARYEMIYATWAPLAARLNS